jgi:hypothetical protein
MERLQSSPDQGLVSPPFGVIRPTAVSHDETVFEVGERPCRHVHSLMALMQPSPFVHMMEVWPHAQDEFCCLVRHHFRAIPTPRTFVTTAYRFHPACLRLTAGGVPFPGSLFFSVSVGRREPSPPETGRNEYSGSPSCLDRMLAENDPTETPGSQVLRSCLLLRMPSALLRVPDRCMSPLLPSQHRPSP